MVRLPAALQEYTLLQLRRPLSHTRAKVRHVTMRLSDLNGAGSGNGQRCGIHVVVEDIGQVVTLAPHDLHAAISQAARQYEGGTLSSIQWKTIKPYSWSTNLFTARCLNKQTAAQSGLCA